MAILNIVKEGDELLTKRCRPVEVFDQKLWDLLDDMWETLEVVPGSGLSAVQVGVLKRVFVININNMRIEFVNPEIISQKGEQYKREGCLSVKLNHEYVKRPFEVTVRAYDRYGNQFTITCEDWTAVCLCHESDHLDGILYIDKKCVPPKGMAEE